jgi:hypothetical protein
MRINELDKKGIKRAMRLFATYGKVNHSEIAKNYGISRVTTKKWFEEIRNEQLQEIDRNTLKTELWRLEQKAKDYGFNIEQLSGDLKHHYDKFPYALLDCFKSQWEIDKELFLIKLDLYTRILSLEDRLRINAVDQKVNVVVMNYCK